MPDYLNDPRVREFVAPPLPDHFGPAIFGIHVYESTEAFVWYAYGHHKNNPRDLVEAIMRLTREGSFGGPPREFKPEKEELFGKNIVNGMSEQWVTGCATLADGSKVYRLGCECDPLSVPITRIAL